MARTVSNFASSSAAGAARSAAASPRSGHSVRPPAPSPPPGSAGHGRGSRRSGSASPPRPPRGGRARGDRPRWRRAAAPGSAAPPPARSAACPRVRPARPRRRTARPRRRSAPGAGDAWQCQAGRTERPTWFPDRRGHQSLFQAFPPVSRWMRLSVPRLHGPGPVACVWPSAGLLFGPGCGKRVSRPLPRRALYRFARETPRDASIGGAAPVPCGSPPGYLRNQRRAGHATASCALAASSSRRQVPISSSLKAA